MQETRLASEDHINLEGRNAIVTGSSRGLGFAISQELVRGGANVLLVARGQKNLEDAKEILQRENKTEIYAISADITDEHGILELERTCVDVFDHLDILVINTGGPPNGMALSHGNEAWWEAFNIILLPSVRLTRILTPHFRKGAAIVYLAGVGAKEPLPHSVLSNAMHVAVMVLCKVFASEASELGIRVNCVLAGAFDTGRLHRLTETWARQYGLTYQEALEQRYINRISGLHRLGQASELARAVAFLCSSRASYITGTALSVDGGFSTSLL